jgi:hypothetical protein
MITDLISLQDAIALAQSVPDYYNIANGTDWCVWNA